MQPVPELVVGLPLPTTAGLPVWLPWAGATTDGPLVVTLAAEVGDWLGVGGSVVAAGGGTTGAAVVGAGTGTGTDDT